MNAWTSWRSGVAVLAFVALALTARAAEPEQRPLLHPLFCDHAVLQRAMRLPVWGWTEPGASVTVSFAGQSQQCVAGEDGKWSVKLAPLRASTEPRTLTVTSSAGPRSVAVQDVLVGDVWLCSGQSNMEMGIGLCNATNDIATANYPNLRLLTVPKRVSSAPLDTLECRWTACNPQAVSQGGWGGFSATAFYFGRDLQSELKVPIGLIHSSWGGTVAEAWTSAEALQPLGDFKDSLERMRQMARDEKGRSYGEIYEQWCLKQDTGTREHWENPAATNGAWQSVQQPQAFERIGLKDYDGMVWFRREFAVPETWAGKNLRLDLGYVDDYDTTWVNGERIGQTYQPDGERHYTIPAKVVHPGQNTLAIRVLDTGGLGGLMARPDQMRITPAGEATAQAIALSGEWTMQPSLSLSQLTAPPPARIGNNPNVVAGLYNAMIAPLVPYGIKGGIWYQGEANADRAAQYQRLLPAMIQDWRNRFGEGDFPFYIVQLAAWQATSPVPRESAWAELREAQAVTAKNVPNSGLAVAIDVGDANDIHPKDKRTVGQRLALVALAKTYGRKIEYSGPQYSSMEVAGESVRLKFDHVEGGLVVKGEKLNGFAIAGENKKFVWADARIDGDTVIVSAPEVRKPMAVRYAWDINPVCNLYNQAGLPAVPFRASVVQGFAARDTGRGTE
jgi:sialate O-acetylesterase